jgi:enediyne biosynthesis protein E4
MRKLILLFLPLSLAGQTGGFTRITAAPFNIIPSQGIYRGAAWVDVDADDDIDLFVAPDKLYINNGGGNFALTTPAIGSTNSQNPAGSSWADVDNDGDIDCYLSADPSGLYLNNGGGVFTAFTGGPLGNYTSPTWGCAWADADNNGFVDLVTAYPQNYLAPPNIPSSFFVNAGNLNFTAKTGYFFTDSLSFYTVPYWSDYDLDGDQDLFIASGPGGSPGPDYHYINALFPSGTDTLLFNQSDTFALQLQDGQCYNFVDTDNDGDLDLYLTNYSGAPSRFFKNNAGVYTPVLSVLNLSGTNLANAWGDYDNDGDLDVIVARDVTSPGTYFRNDGNDVFSVVSTSVTSAIGESCITNGDYDNDGDLDVFVMGGPLARGLFRNDSVAQGRHSVNFSLRGVTSNASAIGATVRIKAIINGNPVWQLRQVSAQNTFQGQHDLRVHFGLNDAVIIDSVIINWPSGSTQVLVQLTADRFYVVTENGSLQDITGVAFPQQAHTLLPVYPNPATDRIMVKPGNVQTELITYRLFDSAGHEAGCWQYLTEAGGEIMIRLPALPAGTYWLTAVSSTQRYAAPCVIK